MSDFRALAEKTVVELFDMVKEKVAEIERQQAEIDLLKGLVEIKDRVHEEQQAEIEFLKSQLSLQRDRNKALETELTSSRNYGDELQKRVDETLTWLTRTDIRAINMAREILQGGDLKALRGANA